MEAAMTAQNVAHTYPPAESKGGWHVLDGADQVRQLAGMDLGVLAPARDWNAQFGIPSVIAIVRHGYLVAEWFENNTFPDTRFNIHSCTKSFTGTAYGMLFDDARRGLLGADEAVDLDTPAYAHIPAGHPLTDPRKEAITLRHLMSMSSGIPGESAGIRGVHAEPGVNPFEAALGHYPLLGPDGSAGLSTAKLAADPGTKWDYCDPGYAHLALAFVHITGQELADFMQKRLFAPIGIESLTWDALGYDDGRLGRHTTPFTGIHISARELARFGYLMLRGGVWEGERIVPQWWLDKATRSSQTLNPFYGLTWWANTGSELWEGVPSDTFAALGFNTNLCCVIPSLDLVIVRIGAGPTESTEFVAGPFLAAIVAAVTD
jgi:CubicO group peptidase (beta-lactamase class C family)